MKMLRNLRLPSLIASAAIAGLSFTAAYAVPPYPGAPNYQPDSNSPINAPNADGVADLSFGLGLIDAQLTGDDTLELPRATTPTPETLPDAVEFETAVLAAFNVPTTTVAEKAEILRAALFVVSSPDYKLIKAKGKDIVRKVMLGYLGDDANTESNAITILKAGLVPNVKPTDLMAGLILAIGDIDMDVRDDNAGEIAAGVLGESLALNYDFHLKAEALVASLAEQAIKNTKPGKDNAGFAVGTLDANVGDIAKDIMAAVVSANGGFAVDNAALGIMKAAKTLISSGVTYSGVMSAIKDGVGANTVLKAHAVAGLARSFKPSNTTEFALIKSTFANADLDAVVDGFVASIGAADDAARVTAFGVYAGGNSGVEAAHYALGVVTSRPGIGELLAPGMALIALDTDKQLMLEYMARAAQSKAGKAAAAAVSVGGLDVSQALAAALPNVTASYAGPLVSAVGKADAMATGSDLIIAAVNALEGASASGPEDDFKAGVIHSTLAVLKLKRTDGVSGVITGGLGAAEDDAGTKEAIAAAVGFFDPKNDHTSAIGSALSGDPELSSVQLAEKVARLAKVNSKLAVPTILKEIRDASASDLAAAVIGGGIADPNSVHIYMASALREGKAANIATPGSFESPQKQRILNYAKAISVKAQFNIQLAYDTAESILAAPLELFETVDHQMVKYPKLGPVIAGAAAAAEPKYAHFVARAAGFRSTTASVSKIPLEIIKGADMAANNNNNPAAVAAISAGFISGIIDSKQATALQTKLLTSGMTAVIKAAVIYGNKGTLPAGAVLGSGTFQGVDPLTGLSASNQPEYGSAAAVTGAVSVLSLPTNNGLEPEFDVASTSTHPLTIILRAAGAAAGTKQMAVIAHAAAQAAATIFSGDASDYNVTKIALAISQGVFKNPSLLLPNGIILAAANAGKADAVLGRKGAGAAGVLDYAHFNTNNSPVTDISNF